MTAIKKPLLSRNVLKKIKPKRSDTTLTKENPSARVQVDLHERTAPGSSNYSRWRDSAGSRKLIDLPKASSKSKITCSLASIHAAEQC
jgi:hypothetical protein